MLYLDTSLELHGVTLFRDYNATSRYYYMPRSPRLSREAGQPMFQLLVYRDDIAERPDFTAGDRDGGGFLTMTVDLGISAATLDQVKRELESRVGGDVDLVPVPFERGSVRVTALGVASGAADDDEAAAAESARFVENILASAKPSLYGDNKAVFSMELSKRGAILMRASIEDGGASQIGVVYELDYKGLMPARECKITINFRQSYQHLRTRAQLNTLWFKSDIDVELETLRKEGAIKIEDVDYLGLEPAALAERATQLQNLAKELATWAFFRPAIQPGTLLAQDRGNLTVYDPTSDATHNTEGFTTPIATTPASAAIGRGATGETAGPPLQGRSARAETTRVDGSPPPPAGNETPTDTPTDRQPTGGGEQPAQPTGTQPRELTAVERWNRAGRPQASFLLRSLTQEEQQTITYDLRQISAVSRTAAPQSSIRFAAGDANLRGRVKVVDLNDPFFEVIAGTVTSNADSAALGVRSMVVKLRYGVRQDGSGPKDTKEIVLEQAGQEGTYQFHLDHRFDMEIEYQVVVHYVPGFAIGDEVAQATSEWIRTSTRNLDVDPRVVGDVFPVTLTAGQIDWTSVRSVQATVEYSDAGINADANVVITQERPTAVVQIRPKKGGHRNFKVSSTYFYDSTKEGPVLQDGSDATLVVLNQPPSKAVPVSVALVDPLGRIRKASVELSYTGASGVEQRHLLELAGEGASGNWTFFRDALGDEPRYRHRTTIFRSDGTTEQGAVQEETSRQLIVGDISAGMLQVAVRLLVPDLAAAGFQLAKLRLSYADTPPWADGDVEQLFEGVPQPFTWRVPMRAGGGRDYTFSMEWFRSDGTRVRTEPQTVRDEVLIITPPGQE